LESQNRIAAMALLHEELYESDTLSNVDLQSYVSKLASQLAQLYDPAGTVALRLDLENIHMQMDAAVPCGLIINELVTNSYKHAFADGSGGTLRVELVRLPQESLRLAVSDSGHGYPEDLDLDSGATLGMSLVESLCEQLQGTLKLENRGGAYCSVDFPVPPIRVPS
jgi:two-component sensor histidine kinase